MGLNYTESEQGETVTLANALVAHMTADGRSVRVMKEKIAVVIGIDKRDFDKILNGERGITEDQAEKLGRWFKNGKEFWTDLQRKRPHQEPGIQPRASVSEAISTVPSPVPAPIPKGPEDDPALWPHAEYAVRLLRENGLIIELAPDLIMGGEVISNWQKDPNDPYSGELFRRLHIVYIQIHPDGSITPLKGKAVIFHRPARNSGKWSIYRLTDFPDADQRQDGYAVTQLAMRFWWVYSWKDREIGEYPNIIPKRGKTQELVSTQALMSLPSSSVSKLMRRCSQLLLGRSLDSKEFEYRYLTETRDGRETKPKYSVMSCVNAEISFRHVPVKLLSAGKRKASWVAEFTAKNGELLVDGDSGEWTVAAFLVSGRAISPENLLDDNDSDAERMRIDRYLRGEKSEFIPEANEYLRKHAGSSDSEYYKKSLDDLDTYVQWASSGLVEPRLDRVFSYPIRHAYRQPNEIFHAVSEHGEVVYKIVILQGSPLWKHADQTYGTAYVSARNGDGIKHFEEGGSVYYFPFDGHLFHFSGRETAPITETRFLRYVDGYHKEILPELEAERTSRLYHMLDETRIETLSRYKDEVAAIERFLSWSRRSE